ncbi:integration host factor, actinobacterial type [Caniella muris]|uniref:integration host factor, actinobacterial type n=1 Tax=Caniella muris TaxID=2941502 RepID=UPI00203DD1FD|nr:integration host factor, actinobacterial type [Caniella muris]
MKPTDTFKYQLLERLCAAFDGAAPADEPPTLVPSDILPSYLEHDDEASRKQAQWIFSAVQSLESQRIVRMTKSKHDGGTYVDTVTLEDADKAAHELEKLAARVAQEEAEQARAEEAVARKRQAQSQGGQTHAQRHGRRRTSGPVDPRITEEAAEYLDEVDSPLTPRELSLLVTGDTKKLDRVGLKRVAQTLRRRGSSASRSNVGALEEAGVVADLKTICVKGPVVLITQKGAVDASILPNGISMFDADLANIDRAYVRARRIVTVENLDAYRRCNDDDVYIYTQGSVSPRHRALLRMIHEQNPDVEFAHFGDIDYAGLKAHKVIEDTLGCEVGLFHMGIAELANPAYRKAIHPLTSKDRDLLAQLLEYERYRGLVSYMLERNVKLEQEIVALDLFSDYDVDSAMAALPAGRDDQGEGQQQDGGKRREGTYRKQSQRSRGQRRQQAADGQGAQQPAQQAPKDETAPKVEPAEPEAAVGAEAPADAAPAEKADAPKPRRRRRSRRPKAEQGAEGQVAEEQGAEVAGTEQPAADADAPEGQVAASEAAPEEVPAPEVETEGGDARSAEQDAEPEQKDVRPGRAGRRRRSARPKAAAEKAAEQPEAVADAAAEVGQVPEPEDAPEPAADQPDAEAPAPETDAPKPRRRRRSRKPKAAQPEAADAASDAPVSNAASVAAASEADAPADAAPEAPATPEPAPAEAKPVSKAAQTRKLRSDLLANIKSGAVSPADVLDAVDDAARSLTVVRFLSALPGWDRARATAFMEEVGISAGRTLRGLGKKQRARVVEAVNEG